MALRLTASAPPRLVFEAAAQLLLLGCGLAAAARPLGWRGQTIAFLLYGLIAVIILAGLAKHLPHRHFGAANAVTLLRAAGAALLLGAYAEAAAGALALVPTVRAALVGLGGVVFLLDGVDGWLARRHGIASAFGARFDMETDALLVLALALLVHQAGQAPAFVLASGFLRYAFVAAGWGWRRLRRPLPPSRRRQAGCVVQTACLLLALAPAVEPGLGGLACALGLAFLIYSFAVDLVWLAAPGWWQSRAAPYRS